MEEVEVAKATNWGSIELLNMLANTIKILCDI